MLGAPFYHGTIKKTIVAFGELFSDVKIERRDESNTEVVQLIRVPIGYGPKEKWLRRLQENNDLQKSVLITVPRMAFELTSYQYDVSRKLNQGAVQDATKTQKIYTPVPYNLGIDLHIMTRTQEDTLNLIEQILPYFAPNLELTIDVIDDPLVRTTFPISLNGVNTNDNYDVSFEDQRVIITTLSFTAKINLYGPIKNPSQIKHVIASVSNQIVNPALLETYNAAVTPLSAGINDTYTIIDNWEV